MTEHRPISRRSFLHGTLGAAAGAALAPWGAIARGATRPALELALQSYSLEELNLGAVLAAAKELGFPSLELYDRQLSVFMSERDRQSARKQIEGSGVAVPATYTEHFSEDEKRNRAILDFGREMGLRFFSCRPEPAALEAVAALLRESDVGVAIHNTTPVPGHEKAFDSLESVMGALDRHERVAACADIGNFARGRIDPVRALRELRGRIAEVHVKDVDEDGRNAPLGEGVLDLPAVIAELAESGFGGLVTLEHTIHDNTIGQRKAAIAESLKRLRRWLS